MYFMCHFWNFFLIMFQIPKGIFRKKGKKLIPFFTFLFWIPMQFKILQYQWKIIIITFFSWAFKTTFWQHCKLLIWFCALNILFESKYGTYNFSPKIRIKPWCGLPLKCLVCSSSVWVLKLRNLNVTFVDTFT